MNSPGEKHFMQGVRIERNYLWAAAILSIIILIVVFSGRQGPLVELYDFGEHAASIREMSSNLRSPRNPLLADAEPTLRYTPYIFLLALIMKLTPFGLFTVIKLASLGSFLLFLTGVYLWSRQYYRDEKMPLYVLLTLLFLWGKPFGYSNEYCLRFLSYTAFYPSIVAFSLSFTGLYFWLTYMRNPKSSYYLGYVVCNAAIFLTHPLTASFFLLSSLLLTVTESPSRLKHAALYFISFLIAGLLAVLWPYYPFLEALTKSTTTAWYDFKMYLYQGSNVYRVGPALLGLPVLVLFLLKRTNLFIVYGFAAGAVIYAAGRMLDVLLLDRYIFFMIFFLHLSLAWYLRKLGVLSFQAIRTALLKPTAGSLKVLFFAAVLWGCIFYQSANLAFEQAGYRIDFMPRPLVRKYKDPLDNYEQIRNQLNANDIVLSDPLSCWLIPAFTGAKIVVLYHNNPMVADNDIRTKDVLRFYDGQTTLQVRKQIIAKYSASHVLLNRDRMADKIANRVRNYYLNYRISDRLTADMAALGKVVFENDDFTLFKLKKSLFGLNVKGV